MPVGAVKTLEPLLAEHIAEIITPVDGDIADRTGRRERSADTGDQVHVEREGPFLSQLAVVIALRVVVEGEVDGQTTKLGPADDGNGSGLVAVAGVDAADAAFPRIGAAGGAGVGGGMTGKLGSPHRAHLLWREVANSELPRLGVVCQRRDGRGQQGTPAEESSKGQCQTALPERTRQSWSHTDPSLSSARCRNGVSSKKAY